MEIQISFKFVIKMVLKKNCSMKNISFISKSLFPIPEYVSEKKEKKLEEFKKKYL